MGIWLKTDLFKKTVNTFKVFSLLLYIYTKTNSSHLHSQVAKPLTVLRLNEHADLATDRVTVLYRQTFSHVSREPVRHFSLTKIKRRPEGGSAE